MLHVRKKSILLGLVEAMNLIDKENGLAPDAAGSFGVGHHGLDLFNPAENGAEWDEIGPALSRHEAGQCRLSRAGRSPEDQRREASALDLRPEGLARAQDMFLT